MNALEARVITDVPPPPPARGQNPSSKKGSITIPARPLHSFILLLLAVTFARILIQMFSPLDLSPDEAHYWEWSRRLDWSYYSKGPIVAWLIALSTSFWGNTQWGVRFPALVHSVALMAGMYWFLGRNLNHHIAFWSVALLHSSVYFFSLGLGMTTDAPCLFAWFLALVFAYRAVFQKDQSDSWRWAGICAGIATLSKYTALFIFPGMLFTFLVVPSLRTQVQRRCFWQGWGISLIALLPALIWNYQNGWVNFLHNSGHLIPQHGSQLRAWYILELFLACVFMVGPILLGVLAHFIWTNVRYHKPLEFPQTIAAKIHFCLIPGLCLLGVCLAVALQKRVYPNWTAPAFLYLTIATAFAWRHTEGTLEHYLKWIKSGLILNCVVLIIGTCTVLGCTWGIRPSRLPVKKLTGWRELGTTVTTLIKSQGTGSIPIITDSYEFASELAFYTETHPVVYCARLDERRMNQYDVWGGWEMLAGKTALIVLRDDHVPEILAKHFAEIRPAGEPLPVIREGDTLRTFYFFTGTKYDGSKPETGKFF